jgi:hypothetical protein
MKYYLMPDASGKFVKMSADSVPGAGVEIPPRLHDEEVEDLIIEVIDGKRVVKLNPKVKENRRKIREAAQENMKNKARRRAARLQKMKDLLKDSDPEIVKLIVEQFEDL